MLLKILEYLKYKEKVLSLLSALEFHHEQQIQDTGSCQTCTQFSIMALQVPETKNLSLFRVVQCTKYYT